MGRITVNLPVKYSEISSPRVAIAAISSEVADLDLDLIGISIFLVDNVSLVENLLSLVEADAVLLLDLAILAIVEFETHRTI